MQGVCPVMLLYYCRGQGESSEAKSCVMPYDQRRGGVSASGPLSLSNNQAVPTC